MENPKVLFIHDDETIARYIREKLTANLGYVTDCEFSLKDGFDIFRRGSTEVVIVKYGLFNSDTPDFIKNIKKIDPDCIIIIFFENPEPQISRELLRQGVYDFITKPINLDRLYLLVQKGLELHSLLVVNRRITQGLQEQNASLQKQNAFLAKKIEESTFNLARLYENLRTTYMRTIKVLAQAIDARDHYTHSHSENVAKYAVEIADEMGLSVKDIEVLRESCELHDLGKIGVEDSILSKPSSLNAAEWEQIKRHPIIAAQILEPLTFLSDVTDLVMQHHEHYDGTGYPEGRKGDDILLGARIIHLADAYESMRSARSYRKIPLTKEEALSEIRKYTGTQFDPKVVEVFLSIVDTIDPSEPR